MANFRSSKKSVLSLSTCDSTNITETTIESIPLQKPSFEQSSSLLTLSTFKIFQCKKEDPHSHKQCPFFHNDKDKRRENVKEASMCSKPDSCNGCCFRCHNNVELLYHRDNYKAKFCSFYPNKLLNCEYGRYCSFAHSESEIRSELIHNYVYDEDFYMFHYKTVWCPFNLSNHNKAKCVYAHNLQDFRRKPNEYTYNETACPNWSCSSFIKKLEDGCSKGNSCMHSHGWKEAEFHPLSYKTRPCLNEDSCPRGNDCPFYHSPLEKRIIEEEVKKGIFRLHPRNRILNETFKVIKEEEGKRKETFEPDYEMHTRRTVQTRTSNIKKSSITAERRISEQVSSQPKVRFSDIASKRMNYAKTEVIFFILTQDFTKEKLTNSQDSKEQIEEEEKKVKHEELKEEAE